MDRRTKTALNRDKAAHLNEAWNVGAAQGRYSQDDNWYSNLIRFPAALFDAYGYILFETEEEYLTSPYLRINKQINVPKPGISAIPGYVTVTDRNTSSLLDVDIHTVTATEGRLRLILHLQRERNQTIVNKKKKQAVSLNCEVCGFSFGQTYGSAGSGYCEVHHLLPLSEVQDTIQTQMEDLAILCASCHRIVHLKEPPYTLDQVRNMLAK